MKLSDTQSMILLAAAQHEAGLAHAPKTLPAAARNAVFRAMLKNNLITEINAPREHVGLAWRQDENGTWIVARITDEGMRAIGIDPNEGDAAAGEPNCSGIEGSVPDTARTGAKELAPQRKDAPPPEAAEAAPLLEEAALLDQALAARVTTSRASLRDAAAAVLAAWEASPAQDATDNPISRAIEALRSALAGKPARALRESGAPRKPREGTKQEQVLAILRGPEGATIAQIAEATGWAQHTVRGFFAGLKKRQGIKVKVLERVRQVGPNKQGAKGSYSIYGIASAPAEVG